MPTNKPEVMLPEAPPIPAHLFDKDQSIVWAAAWETLRKHIADTLTRPADGEFVMVPSGWVLERTAANEVRVTCEGDVSVMAREGGAYSGSLAEYALYGLVSDMLSAAPQQTGQGVGSSEAMHAAATHAPHLRRKASCLTSQPTSHG